jgi:putative ABC transport system ATP-binding protein
MRYARQENTVVPAAGPSASDLGTTASPGRATVPAPAAVELRAVMRGYSTPAGYVTALKGINLRLQPGELVAIVGKSGCGKSVLLNLLSGLDRPTSGQVTVNQVALDSLDDHALARWRGRNVGVLPQVTRLFDALSVLENVQLPLELVDHVPRAERVERAREVLAQVGMLNYCDAQPAHLSVGQRKRVALAQSLANDPPLLLADEPTGALDSVRAEAVFRLFVRLADAGKTVVMTTHDHELASRARRAVVLTDGELVSQYVASALASLDLVQLNAAAARLKPIRFGSGQIVVRQGERADRFFIITDGEAEVHLERPDGAPVQVATLRAGEYFGEIALLRGGRRTATVRASAAGLDVVALGKDVFSNLLDHSAPTREAIDDAIRRRLAELVTA